MERLFARCDGSNRAQEILFLLNVELLPNISLAALEVLKHLTGMWKDKKNPADVNKIHFTSLDI